MPNELALPQPSSDSRNTAIRDVPSGTGKVIMASAVVFLLFLIILTLIVIATKKSKTGGYRGDQGN